VQEFLDGFSSLAGLLVDPIHETINVSSMAFEVRVSQLTPFLSRQVVQLIHFTLQFSRINGHFLKTPRFRF